MNNNTELALSALLRDSFFVDAEIFVFSKQAECRNEQYHLLICLLALF